MEIAWFAETKKVWSSQRRKEWRERFAHNLCILQRTENKAGRFERERKREREREREKRGEKGLLLLVIDFAGTIFFTNQNNRPYYVCRQPNAAKVVVVVVGPS